MRLVLSKCNGFCSGVKRALRLAYQARKTCYGKVFIDGDLVHNQDVIADLEADEIFAIGEKDWMSISDDDCIIIRAHGCPPPRKNFLTRTFRTVLDGTCPHVAKMSGLIKQTSREGIYTIIIGDKNHPEVASLLAHAEDKQCFVVNSESDIYQLPQFDGKILVIAQSTIAIEEFNKFSEIFSKIYKNVEIKNTICHSSIARQKSILNMKSSGVDAVVVIGGKHSNNTKTLAKLASDVGLKVFHVETTSDLKIDEIKLFQTIGVISGASTSDKTISDVIAAIESWK